MASLPSTMQAWQYENYGEKTVKLNEIPVPEVKKGQLLLKVDAAGLNPIDYKLQTGALKAMVPLKLPITPVMDMSGTVVAVGEEVTGFAVGDLVVSSTEPALSGALAQFAVVPAASTTKVPAAISSTDAAAIPIAGLSALLGLEAGGMTFDGSYKGRVLVLNAAGGVGTFAVQIAKLAGAHVVATAGVRNFELVKGLGADQVLDYKSAEVSSLTLLEESKFDIIFSGAPVTDMRKTLNGLNSGGAFIMLNINLGTMAKGLLHWLSPFKQGKKVVNFLLTKKTGENLDRIIKWMVEGKVKVITDTIFPFANADGAWQKIMDGHATGKIFVKAA